MLISTMPPCGTPPPLPDRLRGGEKQPHRAESADGAGDGTHSRLLTVIGRSPAKDDNAKRPPFRLVRI